ncbi:cytochrome P450 [Trichoderma austrokoningii]
MLPTLLPAHGATYEQATLLGVVLCLLTALLPSGPVCLKRFGGTCMLWMGPKPSLIIHSLKDAHELLTKRGAITASRPRKNILMQHVWPYVLSFAPAGEEMRFFRRIYTNILDPKQSQQVRKRQYYEATVSLLALCETPGDFESHTARFSTSVIFSAVYGVRISRLTHPLMVELQDISNEIVLNAQPGHRIIDWLPFLEKLPKQIEAGTKPACFGINALAHQNESADSMMQSFIKIMDLHPEVQQKANKDNIEHFHIELDRIVGSSRLPTWEDQPNLPYVRALIKELHRYSPIFTFSFPHHVHREYRGYTVPNNTLLLPCGDNLGRDRTRYDDVDAYLPERFLGDNLESHLSARQIDFYKRDNVNYAFGRRMCPGMARIHVAENSLNIQISRFLRAFDTTPKLGAPPLDMADMLEQLTRKPKLFVVDITLRSDAVLEVIRQTAKELHTDITDIDSIESE